ncbi:DUF927 domain-containing protein [Solidesulfovibrio magneticus]|uniref:DUF927 domain-containing protein n=1 Tax=Solidesulfovibrio magneticus (strain ATCC 700980 / DSM 13731 / RS-1) TaxID=573370 RepID=C4XIF9_SOLM1|nr:DUF927 domain-containing protein [Solidesulfovibrio magneticus]BAH76534.1 hypothetical protein DMR_30430 [Solidesulfovibrio magneticus RS-1]
MSCSYPAISIVPSEFLRIVWKDFAQKAIQNICTLNSNATYNFELPTELNLIDSTVKSLIAKGSNVYFQVGLQSHKSGPHKRGKEVTTVAIPGFWDDTDILGPGHKQQRLPKDQDAALELIFDFPLHPTLIVHSGGGLYPFWLFKNPWVFTSDADREAAKDLSKQFQTALHDRGRRRGYELDSTSNLDRLLRIPGSVNFKMPETPRPVHVLYFDPNKRYTLDEIKDHLPAKAIAVVAPPAQKGTSIPSGERKYPPADLNKIVQGCAWMRHIRDDATALTEPEWYAGISILSRCQAGRSITHQWSKPYQGYKQEETDKKFDDALNNAGPRTCENIRQSCGGEAYCSKCSSWGKVKSPAILGKSQAFIKEYVADSLPGAPVSQGIVIPEGYVVSLEHGVERIEMRGKGDAKFEVRTKILITPLVISKRLVDVNNGEESIEIAWLRDEVWKPRIESRSTIFNAREIMSVAGQGLPVNSNTASLVVAYLADFEQANRDIIPVVSVTSVLGWQKGMKTFLWGKQVLASPGSNNHVVFKAQEDGDDQIASGFYSKGSYQAWVKIINSLYDHERSIMMVYASFISPFLKIIEANNFVVDLAFSSSKGKSIALRCSASAWGDPSGTGNTVFFTWKTSEAWIGQTATLVTDHPLILDETKLAGTAGKKGEAASKVSSTIYQVSSGQDKRRGSLKGTRRTGTWRLVLLSTGEQRAVDFCKEDGGAHARVLSLWGMPFSGDNLADYVNNVELTVKENFGHAGPKVVKFILANQRDWPLWRETYLELRRHYTKLAGGNNIAARLNDQLAVLNTVIPLVHAALPELKPKRPIREYLDAIWNTVSKNAMEADRATVALRHVYDWSVANRDKFFDGKSQDSNQHYVPSMGWAGRWDNGKWSEIAYLKPQLTKIIEESVGEPDAIIRTWADRDWLYKDRQGRNQRQLTIRGQKAWVYCLKKATIETELGIKFDDDATWNTKNFKPTF